METQLKLEKLARRICPEDSMENPAFPNCTDRDIWGIGFCEGVELAVKALVNEYSETTKKWTVQKIEEYLNRKEKTVKDS